MYAFFPLSTNATAGLTSYIRLESNIRGRMWVTSNPSLPLSTSLSRLFPKLSPSTSPHPSPQPFHTIPSQKEGTLLRDKLTGSENSDIPSAFVWYKHLGSPKVWNIPAVQIVNTAFSRAYLRGHERSFRSDSFPEIYHDSQLTCSSLAHQLAHWKDRSGKNVFRHP